MVLQRVAARAVIDGNAGDAPGDVWSVSTTNISGIRYNTSDITGRPFHGVHLGVTISRFKSGRDALTF